MRAKSLRRACLLGLVVALAAGGHRLWPALDPDQPLQVPLVRLIATPEQLDKQLVRVIGVLDLGFERSALYLGEVDRARHIAPNAIWLDLDKSMLTSAKSLDGDYVIIEGRFAASVRGHLGQYSGTIQGATRLDRLRRFE